MKTDKMESAKNADAKLSKSSLHKEKKNTHLYFNDKYLKKIPKFANPHHVLVLYVHNNEIHEITGLEHAHNLTNLYLQNNRILRIENLGNLRKLKKLYLGHNTISVVEGLQNLQNLEVLHLEKQCLFEGNCLCFDPRSVNALSVRVRLIQAPILMISLKHTLQILNISYNKIQTISSLAPLKSLRVFNASHNELSNIDEVCGVIKDWFYLKDLVLAANPICKNRLYKEEIIANAYCLDTLDQKNISDHTRNFLKRLHGERIAQRLHKSVNLANKVPELSKNYSSAIQKAVSISILKQSKELDDEIFDEKNAVYIPWRTLPKPQHVAKLRQLSKNHKKTQKRKSSSNVDTLFSHLKI